MGLATARLEDLRSADPAATRTLLEAFDAALDAVEPTRLVRDALAGSGTGVLVGGNAIPADRVSVLAFGKAAPTMARGADQALGELIGRGLVVTDEVDEVPPWAELVVAGHPVPDEGSIRGAHAAIALAEEVRPDGLMLALVSGGGSALLEAPVEGLTLEDIRELNDRLIRSGAPIGIINQVRQALSRVKGGRLASRCRGRVVTLVVSDVGSDPAVVASGPTVAASHTGPDPGQLLDRFRIGGRAARLARGLARSPTRGAPTTPPREDPALILADRFTAGRAAARHLAAAGLRVTLAEEPLAGDTATAVREALASTAEGAAQVLVGETTVEVRGDGRGGRNQHAAVMAGIEVAGTVQRFLAAGTDGIDGPTDAAGGCVDGATVTDPERARRHLAGCDSYPYLDGVGALLRTGKTGTNVADVWIVDKSGQGR